MPSFQWGTTGIPGAIIHWHPAHTYSPSSVHSVHGPSGEGCTCSSWRWRSETSRGMTTDTMTYMSPPLERGPRGTPCLGSRTCVPAWVPGLMEITVSPVSKGTLHQVGQLQLHAQTRVMAPALAFHCSLRACFAVAS